MSYRDEELLRMRQKMEAFKNEQTAENTIEEECKQSIHGPVDFEPMPQEIIDQVFMLQSKPQYVYETPYLPLGLAFTITDVVMDEQILQQIYPYLLSTLKKVGPGVRVISTEKKRVNDILLHTIEFMAQTMTEPTYNNQFICCMDGKMLAGNLMCTSAYGKRYKPIMEEMIETLMIPESFSDPCTPKCRPAIRDAAIRGITTTYNAIVDSHTWTFEPTQYTTKGGVTYSAVTQTMESVGSGAIDQWTYWRSSAFGAWKRRS